MQAPPPAVKLVMEAVCICKGVKPTRVKLPDGKMGDDYWDAAKKMLMDPKFLESLKKYDKDNIKAKVIKKIRPYLAKKDFQLKSCQESLQGGVRLVLAGSEPWRRTTASPRSWARRRSQLAAAEKDLAEVMAALKEKQDALQAVVDKIQNLNDDLKAKQAVQREARARRRDVQSEARARARSSSAAWAARRSDGPPRAKQARDRLRRPHRRRAALLRVHRVPRRFLRVVPRADHRAVGGSCARGGGDSVRRQVLARQRCSATR